MSTSAVETTNPYLAARHVHNERHLSLAKSVCNWHLIAGGLLLATINLTGGLVYTTSKQLVIPSVVAVDEAGSAAAITELQPRTVLDPLVIAAQLKYFLTEICTLSTNDELVRRQMHAASHQCLAPAQPFLTRSSTENTSPETLKRRRVFPVHSVVSPRSPKSGAPTGKSHWSAPTARSP